MSLFCFSPNLYLRLWNWIHLELLRFRSSWGKAHTLCHQPHFHAPFCISTCNGIIRAGMAVLVIKSCIPGRILPVVKFSSLIPFVELHDISWSLSYLRECLVFCIWNLQVVLFYFCSSRYLKSEAFWELELFSSCLQCLWLDGICFSLFPEFMFNMFLRTGCIR